MGQDKNSLIFNKDPQDLRSLIREAVDALKDTTEDVDAGEERDSRPTKFSGLLSTLPNAVLVFNCEGRLKNYNTVAREIFGPSLEQHQDSLFSQTILWRLDHNGKFVLPFNKDLLDQVIEKQESRPSEIVTLQSGTKTFYFLANLSPTFVSEVRPEGAVLSLTDITLLKKLQEQREDQLKSILSELKTPTTLLQGHAQMLAEHCRKTQADGGCQDHISAVLSSVAQIEHIVARLLAYLKCEENSGQRP
ncbi:hypothetical protein SAMN05660860_03223 [Geoalkalibacter ferrihydriticus]|uniref:histidine kinase n=2 Tax=Geoalkalibacter ferrihydriticus TaxID=392333 RepID=A0A0C2HTN9_9BACT|nr:PAS domain-containing protein [Geoalkalibacter ferrihydriticus]KIH78150.1 hypothetical protein GFER_06185 [Geoalkalibacter ferrihydriticus DSM 17813]SDM81513.1 hypothetical protein SAMN05660860_03223 [Geoalkalibacter ferrihydriticus]